MTCSSTSRPLSADRLQESLEKLSGVERFTASGRVARVVGPIVEVFYLPIAVGEICRVAVGDEESVLAQAVGFHSDGVYLMPLGEILGIRPGALVTPLGRPLYARTGEALIGRVIDGLGRPIDGRGPIRSVRRRALSAERTNPLDRNPIRTPLGTGVRAIDGLLTLGKGQRIGIMAGSGVGKSVLLGACALAAE